MNNVVDFNRKHIPKALKEYVYLQSHMLLNLHRQHVTPALSHGIHLIKNQYVIHEFYFPLFIFIYFSLILPTCPHPPHTNTHTQIKTNKSTCTQNTHTFTFLVIIFDKIRTLNYLNQSQKQI